MGLFGICQLTLIPLRAEPSDRSEMVSEILFGETFDVLLEKDGWSNVITHFDKYQGWVSSKMITMLSEEWLRKYQEKETVTLNEPFASLHPGNKNTPFINIAGGSILVIESNKYIPDEPWLTFEDLNNIQHSSLQSFLPASITDFTSKALTLARKYINTPYLWGGRTIFGIDCSGFTQIVYKMAGVSLPRDSGQQAEQGILIGSIDESLPGDLAFFGKHGGPIKHTGMIIEKSNIIHSSGKVRIDKIDNTGIYNDEEQRYTHELRMIKRMKTIDY